MIVCSTWASCISWPRGIRGKMPRWLQEFLTDRHFKVYFEGSYSSTRPITTGVPQGAILSPTLFNVMISDIPRVRNVYVSEYADDILIYATGWNLGHLRRIIQQQIDSFLDWTRKWGFILNPSKSKAMSFSLLQHVPPKLSVDGTDLEYVSSHKYLGLVLDAPRLTWGLHVQSLKLSCLTRVNLLRSISSYSWGADRAVLLKFYIAFIRSKLDYGSIFYESASSTLLNCLNKIQNMCLRIALGVWRSTPILSLEAESNVPPLSIHRQAVLFRYFSRLLELPEHLPVVRELVLNFTSLQAIVWSHSFRKAPLVRRCRDLLVVSNFAYSRSPSSHFVSPFSPWYDFSAFVHTDFSEIPVKYLQPSAAQRIYAKLVEERYVNYLQVFTDGSLQAEDGVSVGAAFIIQEDSCVTRSFRLSEYFSVLGAELFALYSALSYLQDLDFTQRAGVVLYTDSMSSLVLLKNQGTSHYNNLVHRIQSLHLAIEFVLYC